MNRPAGKVCEVFEEAAAREGTYRLLENDAVEPEAIARAAHQATARRAGDASYVFVAVDGTSLNIADHERAKGLGVVGARFVGATGLQVMTALAVSDQGVPLGLCGQSYWARTKPSTRKKKSKNDTRPVEEKETQRWLDVLAQVRTAMKEDAPHTKPWFQLDRGGDAWPVLLDAMRTGELCTIRAAYDRRLTESVVAEPRRYLWEKLEAEPVLGTMELDVQARPAKKLTHAKTRPAREARRALMELRACKVSLDLLVDGRSKSVASPLLYALLARESSETAQGQEPIEWMLLTSHPIRSLKSAKLVLFGYTQRWRIEEFHKTWKSGACKVEDTQLRAQDHIIRWATVLASVAARILRLSYLSRTFPDLPAAEEFSRPEIDAIVISAKSPGHRPGSTPKLGALVLLLARVGGYTGRGSGGPPGALVLARGLLKIEMLALALETGLVEISRRRRKM